MLSLPWDEGFERNYGFLNRRCELVPEFFRDYPLPANLATVRSYPNILRICKRPNLRSSHITQKVTGKEATVQADKNNFEVTLDMKQFAPEEISVKVIGKHVVIEAKHEKEDEFGSVSKQFIRKYLIPKQYDIDQLKSALSSDGVLKITTPIKQLESKKEDEKIIVIQRTEQPIVKEENQETREKDNVIDVQQEQVAQLEKDFAQQKLQEDTMKPV